MSARIDREELRKLIRDALKEALGEESLPPLRGRDREGGKPTARPPFPSPRPSPQGGGEAPKREGSAHVPVGVLTEAKVAAVAKTHSKIVIGRDVAVTPLARDRARELKIEIVRQKP